MTSSPDPLDFSRTNFSSLESSNSGPPFRIDQDHTSGTNLNSGYTASYAPTLTQSAPPTSAPLMSTTADGFQAMPPNGAYVPPTSTALQSALNLNRGDTTRLAVLPCRHLCNQLLQLLHLSRRLPQMVSRQCHQMVLTTCLPHRHLCNQL